MSLRVLAVGALAAAAVLVPAGTAAAATTTTTGARVPATVTVGVATTVTATVRPATATGTVKFTVAGAALPGCQQVAVSSGTATCSVTFGSKTPTRVVAKYSGDAADAASQGAVTVTAVDGGPGKVVGGLGACTKKSGALVAVSFGAWGGPIVRGCDTTLTTGIELMTTAGFTTAGTAHDGPAFICRIGHAYWDGGTQYPTPATEACQSTPPADAYWSYWLAPRGQNTWQYSPLGAYSDQPKAGEVEAWTFGSTDIAGTTGQPSFTPNDIRRGLPAA